MTDELDEIRVLAGNAGLPSAQDLAGARARLLAQMSAIGGVVPTAVGTAGPVRPAVRRSARRPGRWPARRLVLAAGLTTAVAAGIAAVLTIGPTVSVGDRAPVAQANAAEVLQKAADAAASQPELDPRPNQFIYARTAVGGSATRQAWLSVDGTRDGLIVQNGARTPVPGCRNGRAAIVNGNRVLPGQTESCVPDPAYQPSLPTTADAMLAYLRAAAGLTGKNPNGSADTTNRLAKGALFLAEESYLRPAARAALYQAAAKIPGIVLIPDAVDAAGRHGVGVAWSYGGREMLIFDSTTYRFLGSDKSAVLALDVVDEVGQVG